MHSLRGGAPGDMLSFQRRATVCGCAGSGKTMLAMEKARRLAAEGFDVLLTCFNVQLANHLANRAPDGVSVFHFHGLCEHLIKEAGIKAIPPRDTHSYYNQFLPDLMLKAVYSVRIAAQRTDVQACSVVS